MKFFIDFEANQFSDRIISIGCVNENNEEFKTFVKLPKGEKLTNFITNLTGITREMLEDAPSADEAFSDLYDWVLECTGDTVPQFYCYGNTDVNFLSSTVKKMSNPKSIMFVNALQNMMIDYATEVAKYFASNGAIALKRVFAVIREKEIEQNHDALEDAVMLKIVFEKLKDKCVPGDKDKLPPPTPKKSSDKTILPDYVISWCNGKGMKAFGVDTFADETNYKIKATRLHTAETKYFNDIDTAAFWLIRFFGVHRSVKNKSHIEGAKQLIVNNKKKFGIIWEWRKENEGSNNN